MSYYQVYEPVEEGSYIKMIDMVSGHGGQIQVSTNFTSFIWWTAPLYGAESSSHLDDYGMKKHETRSPWCD